MASALDSSRNSSWDRTAAGPKIPDRNKTTTNCFIWRAIFHHDREFFWPERVIAPAGLRGWSPHLLQNEAREPVLESDGGPVDGAGSFGRAPGLQRHPAG